MSSTGTLLTVPTRPTNLQSVQASPSAGFIANIFNFFTPFRKAFSLSFLALFWPSMFLVYKVVVVDNVGWPSHIDTIAILSTKANLFLGTCALIINTGVCSTIAVAYENYPLLGPVPNFSLKLVLNILAASNVFFSAFLISQIEAKGFDAAFKELCVADRLEEVLRPVVRDAFTLVVLGTIVYHALPESEIDTDDKIRIVAKPRTYFFFRTLLTLEIAGFGRIFYKSYESADTSDYITVFIRTFLEADQAYSALCRTLPFAFPVTVVLWVVYCVWKFIDFVRGDKEGRERNERERMEEKERKKRERKERQEREREEYRRANHLGFYAWYPSKLLQGPGFRQSFALDLSKND